MEEIKNNPARSEENTSPAAPAQESVQTQLEKTQTIDLGQAPQEAAPAAEPAAAEPQQINIPQAELERMAEPVNKTKPRRSKKEPKVVYVEEDDEDEYEYYYERPRSRGARAVKAIIITLLLLILFGAIGLGGFVVYKVYFYSQVYDGVWVDGVD